MPIGPDRAASVDEMEGEDSSAADDAPVFIQMPADATPAEKLTFSR